MKQSRNIELAVAIARQNISKYKLAAAADINPTTLRAIIIGKQVATPAQAQRIADVLGIDATVVVGEA